MNQQYPPHFLRRAVFPNVCPDITLIPGWQAPSKMVSPSKRHPAAFRLAPFHANNEPFADVLSQLIGCGVLGTKLATLSASFILRFAKTDRVKLRTGQILSDVHLFLQTHNLDE